jgi:hypothetical protein
LIDGVLAQNVKEPHPFDVLTAILSAAAVRSLRLRWT